MNLGRLRDALASYPRSSLVTHGGPVALGRGRHGGPVALGRGGHRGSGALYHRSAPCQTPARKGPDGRGRAASRVGALRGRRRAAHGFTPPACRPVAGSNAPCARPASLAIGMRLARIADRVVRSLVLYFALTLTSNRINSLPRDIALARCERRPVSVAGPKSALASVATDARAWAPPFKHKGETVMPKLPRRPAKAKPAPSVAPATPPDAGAGRPVAGDAGAGRPVAGDAGAGRPG